MLSAWPERIRRIVVGITVHHLVQEVRAVHFGHPHVGHHDVERRHGECLERLTGARHELHVPRAAHRAQRTAQAIEKIRVVVDEQNAHQALCSTAALAALAALAAMAAASGSIGIRIENRVPLPTSDVTRSVPWWWSTMMRRAIASPWPVPLPGAFVVKNWIEDFVDRLLRNTATRVFDVDQYEASSRRVRMRISPLRSVPATTSPMASAAFTTRFMTT